MDIQYRVYEEKDREAVKKLFVKLTMYIATLNVLRRKEPLAGFADSYLNNILKQVHQNKGVIIVAIHGDAIIGCGVGIVKEQTEEERLEFLPVKTGFIPDLIVEEIYRGKGIGSTLIHKIEEYFMTIGCSVSEINVMVENKEVYELYKEIGYKDNDITLQKVLVK